MGEGVILGISTAGSVEVAALCGDREAVTAPQAQALESLVACVRRVLDQVSASPKDVGLIGVCTGPGSFTGLRIGVAFAKSLAQALELPIIGISAYDVAGFHVRTYPVIAVARGKPGHYYARVIKTKDALPEFIAGSKAAVEEAAKRASGDLGVRATIAGPDFSETRPGEAARTVALLARAAARQGQNQDWTNIAIDYGQRPNAVINWEKRGIAGANEEGPPFDRRETRFE